MASYFDCKPLPAGVKSSAYFKDSLKIGKGAFGVVYSATTKPAAQTIIGTDLPSRVAIKRVHANVSASNRQNLRAEIQIMKHINIPRTMKYYGCLETASDVYIISELLVGKDLFDLINENKLSIAEQYDVVSQIAVAINDLHEAGIIHRDLKPENIMYDTASRKLTVLDYGLSCHTIKKIGNCSGISGTPGFIDPYLIPDSEASYKLSDWWAFGQIAYTIFTGYQQYDYNKGRYDNLKDFRGVPPEYLDIIKKLTDLYIPPRDRPNAQTILATFTGIHASSNIASNATPNQQFVIQTPKMPAPSLRLTTPSLPATQSKRQVSSRASLRGSPTLRGPQRLPTMVPLSGTAISPLKVQKQPRCQCIYASGRRKGKQCDAPAKLNNYCGRHQKCKKHI